MNAPGDNDDLLARLHAANVGFARHFVGPRAVRQPLHTVYWGAHRMRPDSFVRLGEAAREVFDAYAEDPGQLARALDFPGADALPRDRSGIEDLRARFADEPFALREAMPQGWLACAVHERVRTKLLREPIEDLRIDFEDGYGIRPDAEENADAEGSARALAEAMRHTSACSGIRIKPLTDPCAKRSIATLERFVSTLLDAHGSLPPGFRITLPKVQVVEHVEVACELLARLERRLGLPELSLPLEIMVEVTQVLFDRSGRFMLPLLVRAGGPRLLAVALGVYDFTASCNVTAAWQSIDHRMCDLARGLMVLGCAGTQVQLCDGSTNILPIEPHPRGEGVGTAQARANREAVWNAWRLSHDHVRRSLVDGWVQGWDLHPAQIPVRFASCFRFYLEALPSASERLSSYLARAVAATDGAAVLDDAATGQALLSFFVRARESGAIGDDELRAAGLRDDELDQRSFVELLASRRAER